MLAESYLEAIAAGLGEQGLQTQTEIVEGKPYLEIVPFAKEKEIDLIVMSTRGQSGLSRWL